MTESFEEMKARYLKQMEEMREKVDRPSSKVAEPVQNVAVASPVVGRRSRRPIRHRRFRLTDNSSR